MTKLDKISVGTIVFEKETDCVIICLHDITTINHPYDMRRWRIFQIFNKKPAFTVGGLTQNYCDNKSIVLSL